MMEMTRMMMVMMSAMVRMRITVLMQYLYLDVASAETFKNEEARDGKCKP